MADIWYYRERGVNELVGPMSFAQARAGALSLSADPDTSGEAEVVRVRGDAAQDPARAPRRLFVDIVYLRGRPIRRGSYADQYISPYTGPATLSD